MNLEMTILKALLKVRLASFKKMYLGKSKKLNGKTKNTSFIFAALIIYIAVVFTGMFFSMFSQLSYPLYSQDLGWVYFALYVLMDFALMFIGTVFTAKAQLYEATDNELLLSMPIPPRYILISRLFVLWILNSFFNLLVSGAAAAAWLRVCPVSPAGAVSFILICLTLPFFSMAISSLFGYLVSVTTRGIRNKTVITMVLSLGFLAVYFIGVNKAPQIIAELAYKGDILSEKLRPVFILYHSGTAIADGSIISLFIVLLTLLIPFAAAFIILDKTFIKNITTSRGAAKKQYVEKTYKKSSALSAFYRKEARRFTNSAIYMMNTGLGAIFEIAAGVALMIKMPLLTQALALYAIPDSYVLPIVIGILCLISTMTDISAPSVSLEGKALWIAQSAPVSPAQPLKAKLLFHYTVSGAASLIASVFVLITLKPSFIGCACCILIPQLFAMFTGIIGLIANLRFPILDWENEAQAVKTGMAVVISMFGCMAAAAVAAGIVAILSVLLPMLTALCCGGVLIAVVDILLYKRLVTKGAKTFSQL